MNCACSWATVTNPLNILRFVWDFAVYCFRRLQVFWARITTPEHAPTIERVVTFQSESEQGEDRLHRSFSLQARRGSVSSTHDSDLSEQVPSNETISQTPRHTPPSTELNVTDSERTRRRELCGQTEQHTPLLVRQTSGGQSLGQSSASDTSDMSYKTF